MYTQQVIHKDRFGNPIEPGDTIIRSRNGSLQALVVERSTPKGIITKEGIRLNTDYYGGTWTWDNVTRKWNYQNKQGILDHIINKTKSVKDDKSN